MRRFKFSAGALTVAMALAVCASSGASAQNLPVHIFDSFNGTSINSSLWVPDQISPGTTQSVHDGSLWFTASSAAGSGFHDGLLTTCVVGNFEAQMEFTLTNFPASDNVSLALNAPPLGNTWLSDNIGGENFASLYVPLGNGFWAGGFGTSVVSGALRLVRHNDEISSYLRTDSSSTWYRIGEAKGITAPTWVGVALWNISNFGGQPVTVAIHSFDLHAAGLTGNNGPNCLP